MGDQATWPAWATAKIDQLSRADARNALTSAQGFWRDFALAGLSLSELREVIEERRRKGLGGRISVPSMQLTRQATPSTTRPTQTLARPDHSLFEGFPPLNPDDERWMHA